MQEQGKLEIPEKTSRPAASSGMIPGCENPGATPPEIERGSPVCAQLKGDDWASLLQEVSNTQWTNCPHTSSKTSLACKMAGRRSPITSWRLTCRTVTRPISRATDFSRRKIGAHTRRQFRIYTSSVDIPRLAGGAVSAYDRATQDSAPSYPVRQEHLRILQERVLEFYGYPRGHSALEVHNTPLHVLGMSELRPHVYIAADVRLYWRGRIRDPVLIGTHCNMRLPHLLADEGEIRENGAASDCKETADPQETHRPAASSGTIPTCENMGVTRQGIEPGHSVWGLVSQSRLSHRHMSPRWSGDRNKGRGLTGNPRQNLLANFTSDLAADLAQSRLSHRHMSPGHSVWGLVSQPRLSHRHMSPRWSGDRNKGRGLTGNPRQNLLANFTSDLAADLAQ
ncbi:hypothetical protein PR048_022755, partial [Dryococelus australis]